MNKLNKILNLHLPFKHYRLEPPEMIQSALMIAVGFSTVPVLQSTLGMTYSEALTVAAIAEILGLLHVTFGDPVVPGWIASALSLVLVYLGGYTVGLESVQALIALQLLVSVIFIVLGATGLAHKLMKIIPGSLKAGILLGAGITAVGRVFVDYLPLYPISIVCGCIVTLLVLYSKRFAILKNNHRIFAEVAKYGMLPGLVVAMIVGFISGEIEVPSVQWGFIPFDYVSVFKNYSVFSIGLPSLQTFLTALPMAISVYIIAFGEIVTSESILKEAQEARPDQKIVFRSNRTTVIARIRNLILSLFAPFTALAGPLWAAVTVSTCARYKEGPKAMKTIYGGMGSFKIAGAICILLMPCATLLEPILPVALAMTLLVQGFACSYIAIDQVKTDRISAGVAGVTGAVVYIVSLNAGLVVGILGYILLEHMPKKIANVVIINERKGITAMKNNEVIITIDQEYGSRGAEVAKVLSERLGIPYYAEEILTEAANQSRIPEKLLRRYDERPVIAAYNLQADNEGEIKLPPPSDFVAAQILACRVLAECGPCILVDRHSALALEGRENVVNIFLHASETCRAQALAEERGVTMTEAKRTLKKIDRIRDKYYRSYVPKWGNASRYNLTIDEGQMGVADTAEQILSYISTATGEAKNPSIAKGLGA
ncbi:MAG: cytidylate kinase family protein [Oscillospiraceae bacterium]|nr:cytidylate kinase family protein [Oscillospiraceae bacterium]